MQADPTLTIEELFAGRCPPRHNPETELVMNVGDLRDVLGLFMTRDKYLPV